VRPRPVPVSWRWFLVVPALFVVFAGLAFLRVWPPLATVMSASMSPTINTGDMVVLQKLDRAARIGDIVVVNVPDEARTRYGYPPVVIHRVVRITADGTVTTKGDARKEPDPFTVPRRALSAHVIAHIPAGGRIMAFLTSPLGLLWLAGGAVMLLGMPLLERRREGQQTVAGELLQLRAERAAVDERCDALSQELQRVTMAFTEHLAALPAQLEAAVAAALTPAPEPIVPEVAERPIAVVVPIAPRHAVAPIAVVAAEAWRWVDLPFTPAPPPIARVVAAAWPGAELPFASAPPPIASVAAAAWAEAELPFARPVAPAEPVPYAPPPPIARVAAVVPTARPVPKVRVVRPDPLDQLELTLFAGPRAAAATDESDDQLAFALDVERVPRFARPCENQLAFALETPAARPDQLVISTPPPGARWDSPPPSVLVRRRSGGLVGRALSLLAA
jgi:signal peptidase I